MTTEVYKIQIFNEGSNAYGVARDERWELKLDTTFDNLVEAKEYIRQQSRQSTNLCNFLQQLRETKEEDRKITEVQFIDDFCFNDDKYLKYRRFFIGQPDTKLLFKELKNDGIVVKKIL